MNRFLITDIRTISEQMPDYGMPRMASISDPYMSSYEVRNTFEITLRAVVADDDGAMKLNNILKAGRTVELNDSEYMDYVEPFKNEFIEFMMEKYPERIIAGTEAWEKLILSKR
jgi:hypothetical protein